MFNNTKYTKSYRLQLSLAETHYFITKKMPKYLKAKAILPVAVFCESLEDERQQTIISQQYFNESVDPNEGLVKIRDNFSHINIKQCFYVRVWK